MVLIEMEILTPGEDGTDTELLGIVEWPFIPRIGDTFIAENLRLKMDEERPIEKQRSEREVIFEVTDVVYRADLFNTFGKDENGQPRYQREYRVEIHVSVPQGHTCWEGLRRVDED